MCSRNICNQPFICWITIDYSMCSTNIKKICIYCCYNRSHKYGMTLNLIIEIWMHPVLFVQCLEQQSKSQWLAISRETVMLQVTLVLSEYVGEIFLQQSPPRMQLVAWFNWHIKWWEWDGRKDENILSLGRGNDISHSLLSKLFNDCTAKGTSRSWWCVISM